MLLLHHSSYRILLNKSAKKHLPTVSIDTDVDECIDPGICQANFFCVNTEGTYHCECGDGYTKNDNEVCQGNS